MEQFSEADALLGIVWLSAYVNGGTKKEKDFMNIAVATVERLPDFVIAGFTQKLHGIITRNEVDQLEDVCVDILKKKPKSHRLRAMGWALTIASLSDEGAELEEIESKFIEKLCYRLKVDMSDVTTTAKSIVNDMIKAEIGRFFLGF